MDERVICYVDDQISEQAARYQHRLSTDGLECILVPPPKWEDISVLMNIQADLFLIDYELVRAQPDGTRAAYQGSTLATELRLRFPECPIALITRGAILDGLSDSARRQLTTQKQLWDAIILKSDIDERVEEVRSLLITLVDGFRALSACEDRGWRSLIALMDANDEEAALLQEAAPPLDDGTWTVTDAAGWVRNTVLRYPGILYDAVNAATRLGISEEAFRQDSVQELLLPAKYSGMLAPFHGCWWKDRLFGVAIDLVKSERVEGPLNQVFRRAFEARFHQDLEPAVCVWDRTPVANWVCHILRKPVKLSHSLAYYPDSRPAVMDEARVSFRAIRESKEFDEELLDAEGTRLLAEIEGYPEP